jgi:hypothetical protein
MFLNWERKGKFYKAQIDSSSSPFSALVTQVPRGFQIGIYFNKSVVASELAKTLKEAKSWSETLIGKFEGGLGSVGKWEGASNVVPTTSVPTGLKVESVVNPTQVVVNK